MALNTVSEIEISYNPEMRPSERPQVKGSEEVADILVQDWKALELRESFKVVLLNRNHRVLGVANLFTGGIGGTAVDLRLIFVTALKAGADSIVLAHNHPSGNLKPSDHDIKITKKIKAGGELLEITVLDHLIITSEAYFSFADEGLI